MHLKYSEDYCKYLGILAGIAVVIALEGGVLAQTTTVEPYPLAQTSIKGNSVILNITVKDVQNLLGYEIDVIYNSSLLTFISIKKGPFLSRNGADATYFVMPDTTNPGIIRSATEVKLTGEGTTGSGAFFTLEFNATKEGISQIGLPGVFLGDENGIILANVNNGTITITEVNYQPYFSTNPADDSTEENPTNAGSSVTFSGAIEDPNENEMVRMIICDSSGQAAGNCMGVKFCSGPGSGYGAEGPKSCLYTTKDSDPAQTNWYAYACDDSNNCSSAVTGTFHTNHRPSATGVAISPESPKKTDDLVCNYESLIDSDSDPVTVVYEWFKNNANQNINSKTLKSGNISQSEVWRCSVTPKDGHGFSGADVSSLPVQIGNTPPYWASGINPSTIDEDSGWTIHDTNLSANGNGYCVDPDGGNLVFTVNSENAGQVDCDISGVSLRHKPAANWSGTASCQIRCSDGFAYADTTYSITVNPVNDPPVINSYLPANRNPEIFEGESINFTQTSSDIDSAALYFYWYLNGNPVSTNQSYTYSPGFKSSGTHKIDFVVSDGIANDSVTWTVKVIDIGAIAITKAGISPKIMLSGEDLYVYASIFSELDVHSSWFRVSNSAYAINITMEMIGCPGGGGSPGERRMVQCTYRKTFNTTSLSPGTYNVLIYSNDTEGNQTSREAGIFKISPPVTLSINITNREGMLVNASRVMILYNGTNETRHSIESVNHYINSRIPAGYWDIELAFDLLNATLWDMDITADKQYKLGIDDVPGSAVSISKVDAKKTIALDAILSFAKAGLTIPYKGVSIDETKLVVYRCQDWNITQRICSSGWEDITGISSIDKSADTVTINVTSFSAFSLGEGSLCGNGVIDSGEGCDGSNLNGKNCASLGFARGTLACATSCAFDTSGCISSGGGGPSSGGTPTPPSGKCAEGGTKSCGPNSEAGRCRFGTQTCHEGMWSDCANAIYPISELCNGIDDDCNGLVDDGVECECISEQTRACGLATGVCKSGYRICVQGRWSAECMNEIGPTMETCSNGFDDDCDGQIDEDECILSASANCSEGQIKEACICEGRTYASGYCLGGRHYGEYPFSLPQFPYEVLSFIGGIVLSVMFIVFVIKEVVHFRAIQKQVSEKERKRFKEKAEKAETIKVFDIMTRPEEFVGKSIKLYGRVKLSNQPSPDQFWYSYYDNTGAMALFSRKKLELEYIELGVIVRKTKLDHVYAEVKNA